MKLRWRVAWCALYPWAKLLLPLRVRGREHLGPGPQVIAANHSSSLDPVIIGLAAAREVHFLAKQELFNGPRAFAWLIRSWNAWPVRRAGSDVQAMRRCAWLLRHRQSLVLFPEGTRSRSGELGRFRPGVGMLAITGRAPVVPAFIDGLSRSLVGYLTDRDLVRRGLRRKPPAPVTIRVSFGPPVRPAGFTDDRAGHVALALAVENSVREMAGLPCRES